MKSHRGIGFTGEAIAQQYLLGKGYIFVEKNFYTRFGEIDLIFRAKASQELVFVEVKYRTSDAFGKPEDAITRVKKRRIQKSIDVFFAQKKQYRDNPHRVDVLALEVDKARGKAKIYHYKGIDFTL